MDLEESYDRVANNELQKVLEEYEVDKGLVKYDKIFFYEGFKVYENVRKKAGEFLKVCDVILVD